MATAEQTRSLYRRTLKEQLFIRRYTGAGDTRPHHDTPCRGRVWGERPAELVGTLNQYDYKAVVFVPDLVAGGFALPVKTADKLIYKGRELAISFPDNATRSEGGELIAYELQVRG